MTLQADTAHIRLHVLASGSKGNAAIVENVATGEGLLIDCGICKRDFFARCEEAGFDLRHLGAVLVTHEHTDHTKGLGVVYREFARIGMHPTLFTGAAIRDASRDIGELLDQELCDVRTFAADDALSLTGFAVHAFATSHDAAQSFGFRFECDGDVLGYMTDTGVVTPQAHEALDGCRLLALEANHDRVMLAEGPYPYPLKRRIASERGHLSNEQAAAELMSLLHDGLEAVIAMHVSENNNDYELPAVALREALAHEGHGAVVHVAYQRKLVSI